LAGGALEIERSSSTLVVTPTCPGSERTAHTCAAIRGGCQCRRTWENRACGPATLGRCPYLRSMMRRHQTSPSSPALGSEHYQSWCAGDSAPGGWSPCRCPIS
jgi:hypothetical protein